MENKLYVTKLTWSDQGISPEAAEADEAALTNYNRLLSVNLLPKAWKGMSYVLQKRVP